ncbi:unnamed protein product [Rhizoctonia solani]|uniref:Zn(2)-C6 fungal-type domain-containing protein n=1 Tax=Rhizoctonia solani TaxID=456999 RepID=A0A8H2XGY5_9AGAM|nr:unnamed protein product [Rhizoctonia solani]
MDTFDQLTYRLDLIEVLFVITRPNHGTSIYGWVLYLQTKKKCDETQPQCMRCIRSGKECEGYAPLESPDDKGIMRRGKVAPGPTTSLHSQSSGTSDSLGENRSSNSPPSTNTLDQRESSGFLTSVETGLPDPQRPGSNGNVTLLPPEAYWNPNAIIPTLEPLVEELQTGLHAASHGNRSIDPHVQRVVPFRAPGWSTSSKSRQLIAAGRPYASISEAEEENHRGDDLQGARQEMYSMPIPDPNTVDNTLPFILQCYSRWIKLVIYEPDRAANPFRESIINQFMRSPGERSRMILLANAIGSLGKSIRPGPKTASLVTYLRTEAYQNINKFISDQPASEREVDMQNALVALDLMMEVVLIQRYSNSMSTIMLLMQAAAPIFRRACPEPLDQYVNLPRAVLSPAMNIRHFATTDIIISITTGRPMLFRYDTAYPPDILEQMLDGRYGLQWLHGIADQYIVILARINVLSEELELGAPINSQCVAEIEEQIREVDTTTERSNDPVATIWKFTVRECWRLTMFVYLYMVLCRLSSADPRVLKLVKSYTRLMEAVKPGRNPDSFLYIPMIIVGGASYRKQDREVIQRRMMGLQECINSGSCGYDALRILLDLWARTEAENRAGDWYDFRVSALRITGL